MKADTVKILFFVFIASICFSNTPEDKIFRILYSVFLYISVGLIIIFYLNYSFNRFQIQLPYFYRLYLVFLTCFILYNIYVDFTSPNFNLVTLINNPYALLSVVPIFSFGLGYNTDNQDHLFKLFKVVSIAFLIFFALTFIPNFAWYEKFRGYHGYVASSAIIPLFIFSKDNYKTRFYVLILLIMACVFSFLQDYRTVILRLIMYFSLFLAFNSFKKFSFFKFLIICFSGFVVYQIVVNLEVALNFFLGFIGEENFASNTRTFLYEELFFELSKTEIIFGRGFLGTYFSEYFYSVLEQGIIDFEQYNRFISEVGFLCLILKGGLLYYFLYIIPLLYTFIKGIFTNTSDSISFNISIYIFTELLLMYFENIPHFGLHFFILFFLAGFAYKRLSAGNGIVSFELKKNELINKNIQIAISK